MVLFFIMKPERLKITKIKIKDCTETESGFCNSRIYVFFNEDFANVPYCSAVKDMKTDIIPKVLKAMKLPPDTKVSFSAYAGCQCGCSPGFIVKDGAGIDSREVFVDAVVNR